MALVLPTSRIYSGTKPLGAIYQGTVKKWEPAPVTPLTHPTIAGTTISPAADTAATSTTLVLTTPTGTVIGDGLVACIISSGQSASDLALPSGWTRIGLPAINDGAVRILGWFFTFLTAAPASNYTFTSPVAGRFGGFMWRVRNVSPTQPHTQWHAYGPRTANVMTLYGMTTAIGNAPTENSLYLACVGAHFSAGQVSTVTVDPAGMTPLTSQDFGLTSGSRSFLGTWQQDLFGGDVAEKTATFLVTPGSAAGNGVVIASASGGGGAGAANVRTVAGMFPNHADSNGVANLDSWESWLGRPVAHISLNTGFDPDPSAMTSSSFGNFVSTAHASGREFTDAETSARVCLTVGLGFGAGNMTPANKLTTLNAVAAGTHDGSYRIVFDRLVAAGHADAYIRLGHEQDITWYPWSALSNNETAYKNAFAHIAAIIHAEYPSMRTVYEGNGGPFDGDDPGSTGTLSNAERAYPGSTAVDVIALNVYARQWVQRGRALLPWTQAFAASKGKPFAVSEWGLWKTETVPNGGGDNVGYIQEMFDIMSTFPISGPGALLYHTYFNELAEHRLDSSVPLSRAKYLELFRVTILDPVTPPLVAMALVDLADCVCDQLASTGVGPTCWCGLYPGAEVSWDYCGECNGDTCGMGWVRLRGAFPYDVFPTGIIDFRCRKPVAWSVEVGAIRCMPTTPDGQLPSPQAMTEVAIGQAMDARAMHTAISCCGLDVAVESYLPLGPLGGCVGGLWNLYLAVD